MEKRNVHFLIFWLNLFLFIVFVHSGRTESQGKIYDPKTEEYASKENYSDNEIKPEAKEISSSADTTVIDSTNQRRKEEAVYITGSNKKYHRDNCWYLLSKIQISKKDAINKGFRACMECKP